MRLRARPATMEDIQSCYPEYTCSFRAMACEMDGALMGVIGLALVRPYVCLFCWFDERLRPYLKSITVLRLLKQVDQWLAATKVPVLAIRERNERKAPHILKRLGFQFHALLDGDAIYVRGVI